MDRTATVNNIFLFFFFESTHEIAKDETAGIKKGGTAWTCGGCCFASLSLWRWMTGGKAVFLDHADNNLIQRSSDDGVCKRETSDGCSWCKKRVVGELQAVERARSDTRLRRDAYSYVMDLCYMFGSEPVRTAVGFFLFCSQKRQDKIQFILQKKLFRVLASHPVPHRSSQQFERTIEVVRSKWKWIEFH